MTTPRRSRSTEAFYGRRHGKTLRPVQRAAIEATLPRYRIDLGKPAPASVADLFGRPFAETRLEIGFGGGERLASQCRRHPDAGFIGVEPFVNGMAKLMSAVEAEPAANLRVYDDDATRLLDWLPEGSVDIVELLYPDPWPKRRHWKRRFVSHVNLSRIARVLRGGGEFRFASDIDHYVNWTLAHCRDHEAFDWQASGPDGWNAPFEGWVRTRYEAKAEREGRRPAYLRFRRR
jgi:tRNA (guanine-N7-)-methyltransferase